MNSVGLLNVLNNTKLQGLAGTANRTFTVFTPSGATSAEGNPDIGYTVVMQAIPWLTWHIYDAGLDVNGTFTKFIPDTGAFFVPEPSSDWAEWAEGSEMIAENFNDPAEERYGLQAWTPAGFDLKSVDVGLPLVYVPSVYQFGTVVF